MSTPLDSGKRASGPPSTKLRTIGDYLNFAVIDIDNDVPLTIFGKNEPDLRADGQQKMGVRLTVLAIGGQAYVKDGDVDKPIEAGEVVSIFISSYAKYDPDKDKLAAPDGHVSWGGALDRIGSENFAVGTVGQYAYLQDFPPSQAGNDPRKDRKFVLRVATAEEAAQSQRCEQLRMELQNAANPPAQLPAGQASSTTNTPPPNFGSI